MESNKCILALGLEASARKYFRILFDYVVDQVSPIISVFSKSPLTTILNFNFSRLPLDCIFAL